jgi:hypothetical protein
VGLKRDLISISPTLPNSWRKFPPRGLSKVRHKPNQSHQIAKLMAEISKTVIELGKAQANKEVNIRVKPNNHSRATSHQTK